MTEKRILLIGGVSVVQGRVREAGIAMQEICEELEPLLNTMRFTDSAPFHTISLVIRFGDKTDLAPDYGPINKRHDELPVAVEMELSGLRTANKEVVKRALVKAVIHVLVDVAQKYGLPSQPLQEVKA